MVCAYILYLVFFFQAEDGIRDRLVTGVQTCALPISVICAWHDDWNEKTIKQQAELKSRQGVNYHMLQELRVMDPDTMTPVPSDGKTMGEVMFRGNVVMKGYLKKSDATATSLAGGWFHSGDLGVMHPDGYIQLKDRSKDIIISGGENISSIEVEDVLYKHPAVLAAADETAVGMFLSYQIGFGEIPKIVEGALAAHDSVEYPSLEDVLDADAWAREFASRQTPE